jgi:phage baseplate assembly protein W
MSTSLSTAWLGRGWAFPVVPDARDRGLPLAEGAEKVRQSIWAILDTEPGERVMRPDFGCGLRRYLMEPNSVATRALIRNDVEQALQRWEPRIKLGAVDVLPGDDPALVFVAVAYTHLLDGRPDNLVYPFYLAA